MPGTDWFKYLIISGRKWTYQNTDATWKTWTWVWKIVDMKKWVHPIPKLGPFFLSILQVRDMIEINLISNSCIFSWVLVQWWIFLKPQKLGNVLYILNGKQVEKFKFRTFPVCTDNQLILLVTGSILTGAFLSILRLPRRVFKCR